MNRDAQNLKTEFEKKAEAIRTEFEQKLRNLTEEYNLKVETLTKPTLMKISEILSESYRPQEGVPKAHPFESDCPRKASSFENESSSFELPPIREVSEPHDQGIEIRKIFRTLSGKSPEGSRFQKCKHCSFKTQDKGDLKRHINDVHILSRLYQCPVCGKCGKQSGNIKSHSALYHSMSLSFENYWNRNPNTKYTTIKNGVKVTVSIGRVVLSEAEKKRGVEFDPTKEELTAEELQKKAHEYVPMCRKVN
jgi:hypothetical protein